MEMEGECGSGGMVVIVFIGFSRLYLGVHYLSDVWGGYLIGALWFCLASRCSIIIDAH